MVYQSPPPWYISFPLGLVRFFQVFVFAIVLVIPVLLFPGRPRGFLLKAGLGTLGGAWQKLAQVLAQQPKLIGRHAAGYLSHLQDRGRARPFRLLTGRLAKAQGLDRKRLVLDEGAPSVAAASCGAVYKATWDGRPVAIKVVLAGARIAYTMDRALLRGFAILIGWIPAAKRIRLPDQLRKIADSYYAQLDLREEGDNTRLMFETFAPPFNERLAKRGSKRKIVIPEMHYMDRDVLVVDWISGTAATKVLASARSPDAATREATAARWREHGEIVIEAAVWASLRREVTHGDLHAGNVYFGEDSVIFLDFGLCSRVADVDRLRLAAGLLSTAGGDSEGVARTLIAMAPTPPKMSPDEHAALVKTLDGLIHTVNTQVGEGSTSSQGLPLGSLLSAFMMAMRQHRVEPHPGFAIMNQNLLAAQGFVGALAPDYNLVAAIREEVMALYNDDATGLEHVKHVILLPAVVGLALRDEGVENLLVSALDLTRAFSPVRGADLDQQLAAAEKQTPYLVAADFQAYHLALLKLRQLRTRPAFRAKVQELVKMMQLSPPHPMVQMTTMFLQNLVA